MKTIVVLIMFLAIVCVLIGVISDIVDTSKVHGISRETRSKSRLKTPPFDGKSDRLFWFVQVTDIHVSKFQDFRRAPDLLEFCEGYLTVINPEFVIVSGDLTDAKLVDRRGSKQFVEEWKLYKKTVTTCQEILKGIKWLDLRGNHDAFNVPDENDSLNLFRKYSIQGVKNPSSYSYMHTKPFGKYSFIALDACPNPGPKRPFNFFGYINNRRKEKLEQLSKDSLDSDMTIWFGHYPTSMIVTEDGSDVRYLMRNSTAFLCGHLHTLGDMVPKMYTRHKTGMLELELGDWRDDRIYRILAIDHNTLSFTDEKFGQWPVILVTNPGHVLYSTNNVPEHQMVNSTHIRMLVFSPAGITKVLIYIDGVLVGDAQHVSGPLYVRSWNPALYSAGMHYIKVVVQDLWPLAVKFLKNVDTYSDTRPLFLLSHLKDFNKVGEDAVYREREVNQPFSLDGTQGSFPLLPKLILMLNIYNIGKTIFYSLAVVYIMILIFLRRLSEVKQIRINVSFSVLRPLVNCLNTWILRIWLVARTPLFYWLCGFIIYIAIGPWFAAEVIQGHTGVLFIWGMYVKDKMLPGSLSYIYGVFQIASFNIPLLLFLGYMMHYLQTNQRHGAISFSNRLRHIYVPFGALVLFQTYITIGEFPRVYGTRAIVLGPVRTGSIFLALYAYYVAKGLGVRNMEPSHRS